jgi:Raf kinase inhibitor-like YbhB/YbcL family protein
MRKTFQFTAFATAMFVISLNASAKIGITSSAFAAGASIPSKYTCDAQNPPNPALEFTGVPKNAKSLVLIMFDPDVPKAMIPTGVFDHWLVWDIAPDSKGIKEGDNAQGLNGTGKPGYVGPCPPDREHRYFFRLYALDVKLGDAKIANRKDLEDAMKGHIIDQGELMGKYEKMKK